MTEQSTNAKQMANAAGQALQEGAPALKHAAERISDLASEGMEAIRDTSRQCRSQLMDASSNAISHIRHRPVQSILIAALLGATAATLVSMLRRRH